MRRLGKNGVGRWRIGLVVVTCLGVGFLAYHVRSCEREPAPGEERKLCRVWDPGGVKRLARVAEQTCMGAAERQKVGAPYMSNPQQLAVSRTARQSTEEVVEDIGNFWTSVLLTGGFVGGEPLDPAAAVAYCAARNVKVKRLIEEGRRDRERVAGLVAARVRRVAKQYQNAVEVFEWWRRQEPEARGGWRGKCHYELVRQREEVVVGQVEDCPLNRVDEIQWAVANGLYVLVNIEVGEGIGILREIGEMARPRPVVYEEFLAFLMDVVMWKRAERGGGTGGEAARSGGRRRLSEPRVPQVVEVTRWNAAWDPLDPLSVLVGLKVTAGQRVRVVVPAPVIAGESRESVRVKLGPDEVDEVLTEFFRFCDTLDSESVGARP